MELFYKEMLLAEMEAVKYLILHHPRFEDMGKDHLFLILEGLSMDESEPYIDLVNNIDSILSRLLEGDEFQDLGVFHSDAISNILIGHLQYHILHAEIAPLDETGSARSSDVVELH